MEKQQREQVDKNIREAKEKLEAELESAKHEHQLMLMRQGSSAVTSCVSVTPKIQLKLKYLIKKQVIETAKPGKITTRFWRRH